MYLGAVTKSFLSALVLHGICQVVLRAQQATEEDEVVETKGIQDIDLGAWQQSYAENQKLLVLLYKLDGCEGCPAALDSLTQVEGQPGLPKGVTIGKSVNPELVAKIGVQQFPSLVFLRDKTHVIYDGNFAAEDIVKWILLASNTIIQRLDENTFGDAISAAPGVNAEDWLLIFYREACKSALTIAESFGVKVYGRIKVAKIHTPENPKLANRFKVTNCPEIIFIKQGKIYKYQSPNFDLASVTDFVENSHSSLEGVVIPEDNPEDNDVLTGVLADFIKLHLWGDNQSVVVASLCSVVAGLVLLIYCCCCGRPKASRRPKKSKKE